MEGKYLAGVVYYFITNSDEQLEFRRCPFCADGLLEVYETGTVYHKHGQRTYKYEIVCECGAVLRGEIMATEEENKSRVIIRAAIRKWNFRK